ncbi:hypothetical protein [Micromonospora sp. SL4-19]|uniref:hypothetical protein n=1 Tax=Micromonospora sp. SL4-19 TaxID=3399129 RepID=UPI003A4D8682
MVGAALEVQAADPIAEATAATKMLASRALRKVQAIERPTGVGREHREVVQAFLAAGRRGDFEELLRVLDPEVKLTVDTPSGVVVTLGATKVAAGAQLCGRTSHCRCSAVNRPEFDGSRCLARPGGVVLGRRRAADSNYA